MYYRDRRKYVDEYNYNIYDDELNSNEYYYDNSFNNNDMYNNSEYVIGAYVNGGPLAPGINGVVLFEMVMGGTQVSATFYGLPEYQPEENESDPIGPLGFHLHEYGDCNIEDPDSPFEAAGDHWNPTNEPHGNHAGDFPVIFSNGGYSNISFFTNKFYPEDVVGKSVIIHQNPDDYRTQPAGNAGKRLACGVIGYISYAG